MTYEVHITLGELEWTLTETPPDEHGHVQVTDGVRVLTGLDFGWAMVGGLWPRQPDTMQAAFAMTTPNFADVADDTTEAAPCAIEVKADTAGPVIARFYGDVTDYKAVSRDRRPGVTISVVAVDPMIRLAEVQSGPYIDPGVPWIDPGMLEREVLIGLWSGAGLTGAGPADDLLWTSPDDPDDGTGRRMGSLGDPPPVVKILDFTKAVLDQAVNLGAPGTGGTDPVPGTPATRMIVAPQHFDGTGGTDPVYAEVWGYTLDTIIASIADLADGFHSDTFSASSVRRDVAWSNVKGQIPGLVVVASNGGDLAFAGTVTAAVDGALSPTYESLTVNTYTEAFAQDVADFYAANAFAPWQLDILTVAVSRAGIGDEIPATLFPNWKADEGDPDRCACYSRLIFITDVDTTRTPDGEDYIQGVLTGARCRISGGELELDLVIRRTLA